MDLMQKIRFKCNNSEGQWYLAEEPDNANKISYTNLDKFLIILFVQLLDHLLIQNGIKHYDN
jgi:hypothetical protein